MFICAVNVTEFLYIAARCFSVPIMTESVVNALMVLLWGYICDIEQFSALQRHLYTANQICNSSELHELAFMQYYEAYGITFAPTESRTGWVQPSS